MQKSNSARFAFSLFLSSIPRAKTKRCVHKQHKKEPAVQTSRRLFVFRSKCQQSLNKDEDDENGQYITEEGLKML